MSQIHIEGMGLLGSLFATAFVRDGIPFSWHDSDAPHTAWKASTGCVFPTGDQQDIENYQSWLGLLHAKDEFGEWVRAHCERGLWTYLSKAPPHDGRHFGVVELTRVGDLAVSNMGTLHMNVQQFVERSRERYEDRRLDERPGKAKVLVTHGFRTAKGYGWGWSQTARLRFSDELLEACAGTRPCLYLRKGYLMYYAYPYAGTDRYIVGTQNVQQSEPKERDTEGPYLKWLEHLESTVGEHVQVRKVFGQPTQGWRPKADLEAPILLERKGGWILRPQAGNGLRNFPGLYRQVRAGIGDDQLYPF